MSEKTTVPFVAGTPATGICRNQAESASIDELILDYQRALERGDAPWQVEFILEHVSHAEGLVHFFANERAFTHAIAGVGEPVPAEVYPYAGSYRLLSVLGKGGMGAVYLAQDTSHRVLGGAEDGAERSVG